MEARVVGASPVRRMDFWAALTAAPAAIVVFIWHAAPLAWMGAMILAHPGVRHELSLDSFRLRLLERTLGYNGAAGLIATAMGLPAGIVLGRGRGWIAKILWIVLPAALLMPSLSYAYGWSQVARVITPSLRPMGISFRPAGPADVSRCVWSLAAWLWAVPAGLIGISLRRMDSAVQQQAILDGGLIRVTLRQLAGPIIASIAIVTILASQEFAVYEPTGISVVATEVRMIFDTGSISSVNNAIIGAGLTGGGTKSPDQPARAAAAVAAAMPMMIVTALLALIAAWGARTASAVDSMGVGDWPRILDASGWTIAITVLLVFLNIGVPVAALILSLHVPFSPTRMWDEYRPQLQGALLTAAVAGGVAMLVALSAAGRWAKSSLAIALVSFLVGGQLLAIILMRMYDRRGLMWAYDTMALPVIAYMGRFGWLALAAGRGAWSRPWRELREAAGVDGAGTLRTAIFVVWPLAWPMLLAGGLLVGALSLTEVPATVLLYPMRPPVLTPMLMSWLHMVRYDSMIEASLLMMGSVLIPALAAVALINMGLRLARRAWRG